MPNGAFDRGNRMNQDTGYGMNFDDFMLRMQMNAAMSGTPYDDFYAQYDPFGNVTVGRQYTNPQSSGIYGPTPNGGNIAQNGMFGGGGGGGATGAKGAATGAGKTAAGTTAGTAGTTGGAAMDWGTAIELGLGAYQAYEGYQNAKDGQGGGPWTQGVTPGYGVGDHLGGLVTDTMAEYNRRKGMQMPNFYGGGGGGRGGGGGGGGQPAGPTGMSYMQDLMGQAMGMTGGSGALNAGMDMLQNRLGGDGGFNPYAGQVQNAAMNFSNPYQNAAFGAAQGMQGGGTNPYMDPFMSSLGLGIGQAERAGSGGGGTTRPARSTSSSGSRSGFVSPKPTGNSGGWDQNLLNPYLKAVLDGKFMEDNPYLEDQIAQTSRDIEAHYRDGVIPSLGDNMERAGMLSSSVYGLGLGAADAAYSQNLSDAIGDMRFQGYETGVGTYMDALGLTNQLQLGNMQAQTSRETAAMSANASMSANRASIEAQQQMHAQQMALGALGLYSEDQRYGMGQMSGLAGMYGDQQLGALGLAGELALGRGQQDLGALGLLPGMEQANWMGIGNAWDMATGMQGMQQQQAAQAAAARNQQAQREQQRWMWNYDQQMGNIGDTLGIVGGIGLDFGQRYGTGSGGNGQSPTQAAIAGFIGGSAQGNAIAGAYGW